MPPNDSFLAPGNTYLPYGFSSRALARFGNGDFAPLLAELSGDKSYERVGVDRAIAIAIDLAMQGGPRNARILDVGSSVGTIGLLLSQIGYQVTAIDSDVVASVQTWQDRSLLESARVGNVSDNWRFVSADLRDFLDSDGSTFDVALLLSVLHHWISGYGYTGTARFDRQEIRNTLIELCSRVRRYIYLEVPIEDEAVEMPPDPEGEFVFPRWFLDNELATTVTWINSTIATNGKPRKLYRVTLA